MGPDQYQIPVRVCSEPTLRAFVGDFVSALGASHEEASIVADGLTTACLWWHPGQGQGLEKLLRYHRRVRAGGIVPAVAMRWEREGSAFALLDASKGFGYVAAHRGMERAISLAKDAGVAMVGIRNSNHFGIAGFHAYHAATEGLIGWAMTNAGAEMAPTGSASPEARYQSLGDRHSQATRATDRPGHGLDDIGQGHDAVATSGRASNA